MMWRIEYDFAHGSESSGTMITEMSDGYSTEVGNDVGKADSELAKWVSQCMLSCMLPPWQSPYASKRSLSSRDVANYGSCIPAQHCIDLQVGETHVCDVAGADRCC